MAGCRRGDGGGLGGPFSLVFVIANGDGVTMVLGGFHARSGMAEDMQGHECVETH